MATDENIRDKKLKYNIKKKAHKISALSSVIWSIIRNFINKFLPLETTRNGT